MEERKQTLPGPGVLTCIPLQGLDKPVGSGQLLRVLGIKYPHFSLLSCDLSALNTRRIQPMKAAMFPVSCRKGLGNVSCYSTC